MALHAHFHLALATEARWIDDGTFHFGNRQAFFQSLQMGQAIAVAALAIDALRHVCWIDGFVAGQIFSCGQLRIAIVAGHTVEGNLAAKVLMIWRIVAGAHGKCAAIFGIPTDGKLQQVIIRGAA